VRFGDPIVPPQLGNNPEAAYAELTAELRRRVVEMWTEMHEGQKPEEPRQKAAAD